MAIRSGLYALTLDQGRGVVVLRVGWLKVTPEDPDEYDVAWHTLYRTGYDDLGPVWLSGELPDGWRLGPQVMSVAHRLHIKPLAVLDPKKWKDCPKPEGW